MGYGIGTKLMKTADRFWDALLLRFREQGVYGANVASPWAISVREVSGQYHFGYEVLAERGIMLRFVMAIGTDLDRDVIERSVVETAAVVALVRRTEAEIRLLLDNAAATAHRIFGALAEAGGRATLVDVGLAPIRVDRERTPFAIEIRYEGLDDHLFVTREAIELSDGGEVAAKVEETLLAQARREDNLRLARDAGGAFLIEGLSLLAIEAHAEERDRFLRDLAQWQSPPMLHYETVSRLGATGTWKGRSGVAFDWKDGVASVSMDLTEDLSFGKGILNLCVPDRSIDLATLAGSPVSRLVEHPMLPADLVVESADWDEGWPGPFRSRDDHRLRMRYRPTLHALDQAGVVRS